MVSTTLLVSTVLALATSQVAAIPQSGSPEAFAIFYTSCTGLNQAGIPAQDQFLQPSGTTCYSFAFGGVDQSFTASGFQGKCFQFEILSKI